MTRGGRPKNKDEPERRCIATGESGGTFGLIRFVVSPDGVLTPDVAEKLPGRGIWLSADAQALETALRKRLFARAARRAVETPDDLPQMLERLILKRGIDAIALARKAGLAVCGAQRSAEAMLDAAVLLQAVDGAEGGRRKLRAKMRGLAPEAREITCYNSVELGLAFGRPRVIHAVLAPGGATDRVVRESIRLQGLRRDGSKAHDGGAAEADAPLKPVSAARTGGTPSAGSSGEKATE